MKSCVINVNNFASKFIKIERTQAISSCVYATIHYVLLPCLFTVFHQKYIILILCLDCILPRYLSISFSFSVCLSLSAISIIVCLFSVCLSLPISISIVVSLSLSVCLSLSAPLHSIYHCLPLSLLLIHDFCQCMVNTCCLEFDARFYVLF